MYISAEHTPTENGVRTSVDVILATGHVPLDAFCVELHVNPSTVTVERVTPHEYLCDTQYIVETEIDNDRGRVVVSCGSRKPFMTGSDSVPVVRVEMNSVGSDVPEVRFGKDTGIFVHYGEMSRSAAKIAQEVVEV